MRNVFNLYSKTYFCISFYLATLFILPADANFSSSQEQYLYYDQNFNVVQRLRTEEKKKANLLSEEDKKPQTVYIYEVDFDKIQQDTFLSQFVSPEDRKRIIVGTKFFIPVLESNNVANVILRLKFGPHKYESLAHKTLSRATYFIDPAEGSISSNLFYEVIRNGRIYRELSL
ncbi:MAG: hypothetical protein KDD45_12735 [Bdellovibrionales bacterium]|nr:hypothetical protein [Bdellovibrionales bacterium]